MTVTKTDPVEFGIPPPIPIRRFTVEEYQRLGEVGVLTGDDRVELLEGWIVGKMIHNPRHDATVDRANETITGRLPPGWRVRVQCSVTTGDSEPEPDLSVVRGPAERYVARHPQADKAALLIEVADTSLTRDRDFKGRIYARARVHVYWIINLIEDQIEVYTDPAGPEASPGFATRRDYQLDDAFPLTVEGKEVCRIPVKDLIAR